MEIPLSVRPRPLAAALGAVVLAGSLLAQPGVATAGDPVADPGADAGMEQVVDLIDAPDAATATERAVEVLGEASAAVAGESGDRDTSMVLLDLARRQADLPRAQRTEARRILARPTDGAADPVGFGYSTDNVTQSCAGGFCVHWARTTRDAPDLTDADANGRPDSVDRVLATLIQVGSTYQQAGYRKPVSDGVVGGGVDQFDVYLVESGEAGVYGYCAPEVARRGDRTAPAYCALDNDFAEFPTHTALENMQVTVAHEYFHAVQFAYDLTEDQWFLESTAVWVEDEMFDAVNDNVQYLRTSPIAQPRIPIDRGQGLRVYGSWIFIRYLSELEPQSQAGLPTIVRDVWERAAGTSYSIRAIEAVLRDRGRSLRKTVARFADANRHPKQSYDEGRRYPKAKTVDTATVAAGRSRRRALTLDHLASGSYRFKPGAGTRAKAWRLRVAVDLPSGRASTAAVVTTRTKSQGLKTRLVKVGKGGNGSLRVPFSSRKVTWVDVTLVNASTRYRCDRGTSYSCQGKPQDDRLDLRVRVRATR